MMDYDIKLYKIEFKIMPVIDGKFSIEYIFPDNGQHRTILQLYKNTTAFEVCSFDIFIPHSSLNPPADANINFFSHLFGNLLR